MRDGIWNRGALGWKGVLAEGSQTLRRAATIVLVLTCFTSVVTQSAFVGLQFADGSVTYLMPVLLPIGLAALLLGTLPGVAMGLFAGTALYLHAFLMPLDYYELTYVTPVTSLVATSVFGLVLGVLLSAILRSGVTGRRRVQLLVAACVASSAAFSIVFAVGVLWRVRPLSQATVEGIIPGGVVFQALFDAIVLSICTLVAFVLVGRVGVRVNLAALRTVFGVRLLGVLVSAFMVVAMLAYANVTAGRLVRFQSEMQGEADYLLNQVVRATDYSWNIGRLVRLWGGASAGVVETLTELDNGLMVSSLVRGYTEDDDGLVIASIQDQILSVDTDRLGVGPGDSLKECLGEDIMATVRRSVSEQTLEQVVYLAPSEDDGLIGVVPAGMKRESSALETYQVGYLVAMESQGYLVVMINPASRVFAGRNDIVGWITVSSFGLLLAMSALVWRLLDQLVARRIDATNEALSRITAGELEVRVEPEGTFEFQELSVGINHTVDALQGWIAEAERRMDEELMTAGAIQESALPSVFPPYPNIPHFDIYASMSAAREVGGDFYDFFLIGDDCDADSGKLGFVIADVSGKGVPAALFMMKAKTQIHDYLESGMELGEAMENANRRLCEGNDEEGMFVTAWVGVLDYATGHLDFVNAGHNPPLLYRRGSWRWVRELSGIPLGILEELPYPTFGVDCKPGDKVLLYTDGVTEAFSVGGEQYGEDRLRDLARECTTLHPHELIDCVRQNVNAYAAGTEQSDDITVLALEVGVPPEEKAQLVVPASIDEIGHVLDFIHAELDRRLCPARVQGQLSVAVEELFVNSCSYAYEGMGDDVDHSVRVTYAYSADPVSLTVEIVDSGVPFDPLTIPDETIGESATLDDIGIGGLGILMAKGSVDQMRYKREGNTNVVTLVKRW